MSELSFKIASQEQEFAQIHRLNYQTFVKEIPQHPQNPSATLIDKFHSENTYIICLDDQRLLGMVAVRATRPFSLDAKLTNLDQYLPEYRSACEIRLLAIDEKRRHGRIVQGLFAGIAELCKKNHYDIALISGTVRQTKMYHRLGFIDFGPLVGTQEALYQPMYLVVSDYFASQEKMHWLERRKHPQISQDAISFMPGPVPLSQAVMDTLKQKPVSHRSEKFVQDFHRLQQTLCQMLGCLHVAVFTGSGTLANDMVALQISKLPGKGIILNNGEFGARLVAQAQAIGLDFVSFKKEPGTPFQRDEIQHLIDHQEGISWLWSVHCETSTGILNDVNMLKAVSASNNLKLCIDAISTLGTMPVDLSDLYLASGVSGKGFGSIPGLAMVFYNHSPSQTMDIPRYLDLATYHHSNGIPFTLSSNLVYPLLTALESKNWGSHFQKIELRTRRIRNTLNQLGYQILAKEKLSSPAVLTICLPEKLSSKTIGDQLDSNGLQLSYLSNYLLHNNWIQICLMGELSDHQIEEMLKNLTRLAPSLLETTAEPLV